MIPPHERRNYSEIYLKLDLGKLSSEVPDFNFSAYLSNLLHRPLNSSEEVVIYALPYFKKLTKLMKNSNKRLNLLSSLLNYMHIPVQPNYMNSF
jgi:hypothetical protein